MNKARPKSVILACILLILLPALAGPAAAEESHYLQGLALFRTGQTERAIAQFLAAARESKACAALLTDPGLAEFPPGACGPGKVEPKGNDQNLEPLVWFQVARIKWRQESVNVQSQGKPGRSHHDRTLFTEFLKRWPASELAGEAALILLEDSFCATWAGFPDCGMLEAKGYEELLKRYPGSGLRDEIELKRATVYCQMAWLWQNGAGEKIDRWSDLFRSQSLEIARQLKPSPNPAIKKAADELEQKLQKDFPRPIAPLPLRVLDPNYN